jgi:hypothetical protein
MADEARQSSTDLSAGLNSASPDSDPTAATETPALTSLSALSDTVPTRSELAVDSAKGSEKADSSEEKPGEEKKGDTAPPNLVKRISETFKAIKSIIVDSFLICLTIVILTFIVCGLSTTVIILDLVEVPKSLQEKGITGSSISHRLATEVNRVQLLSIESPSGRRVLEPSWTQADIQVPGGSWSFRSILSFLKTEFGSPDIHLEGEIEEVSRGSYRLLLRSSDFSKSVSANPDSIWEPR